VLQNEKKQLKSVPGIGSRTGIIGRSSHLQGILEPLLLLMVIIILMDKKKCKPKFESEGI